MLWKNRFKVGISGIDQQHEELFCKVADFLLAMRQDGAWEEKLPQVKSTMEFMAQYVITHFHDEENYQQTINYPLREEHRQLHEAFRADMQSSIQRLEQENYPEVLVQELGGKLLTWLINHVVAVDLKMAHYAKEAGGNS